MAHLLNVIRWADVSGLADFLIWLGLHGRRKWEQCPQAEMRHLSMIGIVRKRSDAA